VSSTPNTSSSTPDRAITFAPAPAATGNSPDTLTWSRQYPTSANDAALPASSTNRDIHCNHDDDFFGNTHSRPWDTHSNNASRSSNTTRHDTTSDRAQRVTKLYNYLLGSANTGLPETSGPKVEVAVPRTPGISGELVGPIRLTATQQTVAVAALPHPLVDATGKEVDLAAVPTGTDLFLKVPADAPAGKANIVANLTGDAHTDQLLVARNGRWQTLIMVKTQQVTATGQGEVPGTTRSHRLDEQLCSPFSSQGADLVEGGAAHELRRGQGRGPLLNQVGGAHEPVLSGA